ncbi:YibE/F family protein, partial [Helicobacter pylori]|uniref:YibE/F family protein n=1 Tax=Helicobacter pylori TaxID=210 RepID=UPI00292D986F
AKLHSGELYSRAMDVGKDHIASMVNTLILVYTGAALPLLLLFVNNSAPFTEVINYEVVAEEIVRTLVASIGLVLAV